MRKSYACKVRLPVMQPAGAIIVAETNSEAINRAYEDWEQRRDPDSVPGGWDFLEDGTIGGIHREWIDCYETDIETE